MACRPWGRGHDQGQQGGGGCFELRAACRAAWRATAVLALANAELTTHLPAQAICAFTSPQCSSIIPSFRLHTYKQITFQISLEPDESACGDGDTQFDSWLERSKWRSSSDWEFECDCCDPLPSEAANAAITGVLHAAAAVPLPSLCRNLGVLNDNRGGGLGLYATLQRGAQASAAIVTSAIGGLIAAAHTITLKGIEREAANRLAAALAAATQPDEAAVLADAAAALAGIQYCYKGVRSCVLRPRCVHWRVTTHAGGPQFS